MTPGDTYSQLVAFLDQHGAQYRLIDHAPEGRTEIVSPMRGNALSQAAKCIVLMVKIGKKVTKYVLYFNAARLDRSMVLKTRDYVALAKPRLERIAAPGKPHLLSG